MPCVAVCCRVLPCVESRVFIENWQWISHGCGTSFIQPGNPWEFPWLALWCIHPIPHTHMSAMGWLRLVASINYRSLLQKITIKRLYSAEETCNLMDDTDSSHLISEGDVIRRRRHPKESSSEGDVIQSCPSTNPHVFLASLHQSQTLCVCGCMCVRMCMRVCVHVGGWDCVHLKHYPNHLTISITPKYDHTYAHMHSFANIPHIHIYAHMHAFAYTYTWQKGGGRR